MAHPLNHLEPGYEILEPLREGGLGVIYKVRHRPSGELRAALALPPKLQGEGDLRWRFLAGAHAATRLGHPNLARIYEAPVDEAGVAYVVMELVPGTTVAELLATGSPVPLALTLTIARQGLAAVGHLHRHGVAHRDLSPDNLALGHGDGGRPLVKLIDLGIARDVDGAGAFLGKVRYAAPETFDDRPPSDPRRSDLYAFALVLYQLLTGRFPIAGEEGSELIAGHLFRPPLDFAESDPEGKVPEPVRRAVLKALSKSPDERFADAESFAAALDVGGEIEAPADGEAETRVLRPDPVPEAPRSEAAALDETLHTIRALRDDGRTGEAFKRLNQAVRDFGSQPTLRTLRDELGEALLERDQLESASLGIEIRPPGESPPAAQGAAPIRGLSDATIRSSDAPRGRVRRRPAPPTAHPTRAMVAAGLVLAAAFASLAYVLTRESPAVDREPAGAEVAPAEPPPGSLALDAAPWGEIVELLDPGAEDALAVSPSRFTPVVLSLPPGEYRITLRYPPSGRVEERLVRVDSGARVEERVIFESLDADQYFERLGW